MILYFNEASLGALLKNAIGCSYPSLFFYNSTTTLVCSDVKEKIPKSLVKSGLIKIGACVNACLTASKYCLVSIFHLIYVSFLIMFVILLSSSARFRMNLLKKLIFPIKDLSYFMFLGWLILRIPSILLGSILIPCLEMMWPKNFPSSSPSNVFL